MKHLKNRLLTRLSFAREVKITAYFNPCICVLLAQSTGILNINKFHNITFIMKFL